MPLALRAVATSSTIPGSWSWRPLTLTAMCSWLCAGCSACQRDRLAQRGLQDHPADRDDQPGLLGERDELRRAASRPQLGVVPADERLEAEDRAGVQLDQRLVVDDELARARWRAAGRWSSESRASAASCMVGAKTA